MREHRVPIMLSDPEISAIDDWRFANRMGSRSSAIRRLCRIALESAKPQGQAPVADVSAPRPEADQAARTEQ